MEFVCLFVCFYGVTTDREGVGTVAYVTVSFNTD
jgi:hypothetical protein